MGHTVVERYAWARELVDRADNWLKELVSQPVSKFIYPLLDRAVNEEQIQEWSDSLASTEVAQPAICLNSLVWLRYLEYLGIKPSAVGGHSLGELTAFHCAGAYDEKTLITLAAIRGQAMSASEDNAGAMASLACSQKTAEQLLQQVNGYLVVANINAPQQIVISGDRAAVKEAMDLATAADIRVRLLPVSNAFHSQLVAPAAEELRTKLLIPEQLTEISVELFSSVRGQQEKPVQTGLNMRQHFANQIISQVDFVSLVTAFTQSCDIIVEMGTGKVLSGLVDKINGDRALCFPLESQPGRDRDLNTFLGSFFVCGGEVNWNRLYENRLVRPFIPASDRIFIENPCERKLHVSAAPSSKNKPLTQLSSDRLEELMSNYLRERSTFIIELIRSDLESDLIETGEM